jgi:hypothetical protein
VTLPNNSLEQTRRGGVPASRAVFRVSPRSSSWCSTDRRASTSTAYSLLLLIGMSTSNSCSQGPPPPQAAEATTAPCPTITVKSKESFKIHAFNEWSTVHSIVSGSPQ